MSWDKFYYNVCEEVSKNSKCLSRKIGTVLVKDKTIIGTGQNGPPRQFPHCEQRFILDPDLIKEVNERGDNNLKLSKKKICPRQYLGFKSGEGLSWCIAGHGERNAIVNSARMGIKTKGATLYMNCPIPCTQCLIEIINSGIVSIVCTSFDLYDKSSKYILDHSELNFRLFDFIKEGDKYVYN